MPLGARPVGQDTGLAEIKEAAASGGPPPAGKRGTRTEQDLLPAFGDHVRGFFGSGPIRPLKIVADCANGMGGLIAPMVFGELSFDIEYLYPELDGTFPNHPADPINPENIVDLQARVKETGADLGLAFDGDADRAFLVDELGQPASGSLVTALVAAEVLTAEPGASIVYNLICSRVVPETIAENGGTPIRSRVGHSFIKQVMAETGAAFGGEHSGHYYFRDNFRADSGILCALNLLRAVSRQERPMSEVLKPLRRYWNSGELNTEVEDQNGALRRLAEAFSDTKPDWTDGLTIEYPDWWFNARASNTEPLLRLNVEARTETLLEDATRGVLAVIRGEDRAGR